MQSLGLGNKKACLKHDAVPTLFSRPTSLKRKGQLEAVPTQKKRKSMAYEKRERSMVSLEFG